MGSCLYALDLLSNNFTMAQLIASTLGSD